MRVALVTLVALAVAAGRVGTGYAQEYALPPGTPPAICAGPAFVDIVGTAADDRLSAFTRATRVWGLAGADRLTGSATRASCLLGGRGNDLLNLGGGGGVAHGNRGRDLVFGSNLGDVIAPGRDADGVVAGGGDDKLSVRDGEAEMVDCGEGADIVKGDRADLLIGCESLNLTGPPLVHVGARPRRANNGDTVAFTLRPPESAAAGAYRILDLTGCGGPAAGELARLGAVRKGRAQRIRVRHPPQGWCPGTMRLAVVRDPGYSLPLVPVARLSFTVL